MREQELEQNPEIVKILIGNENLPEDKLDEKFIEVFKTMCQAGVPVWGFLTDELGQWMFGPLECFREIFGKDYAIIKFNLEYYLTNTDHSFWLTELAEDPMQSRLLKYQK